MKIELRNINKSYKNGKVALKDINLSLTNPSLIGLLGPNGAGKSTLIKLLTANLLQSSGEIFVDGFPLMDREKILKSNLGYLPQEFGLFEDLKVFQFLDYMSALKFQNKRNVKSEIDRVVELTNLKDKVTDKIKTLSGGQKQRVGIAQALLGDSKILIFDEPTVGLDPAERIKFRNIFADIAKDRLVILSTHIIEDIQLSCNKIIILNCGKVFYSGTPDGLIDAESATSLESAYMSLMEKGVAHESF